VPETLCGERPGICLRRRGARADKTARRALTNNIVSTRFNLSRQGFIGFQTFSQVANRHRHLLQRDRRTHFSELACFLERVHASGGFTHCFLEQRRFAATLQNPLNASKMALRPLIPVFRQKSHFRPRRTELTPSSHPGLIPSRTRRSSAGKGSSIAQRGQSFLTNRCEMAASSYRQP